MFDCGPACTVKISNNGGTGTISPETYSVKGVTGVCCICNYRHTTTGSASPATSSASSASDPATDDAVLYYAPITSADAAPPPPHLTGKALTWARIVALAVGILVASIAIGVTLYCMCRRGRASAWDAALRARGAARRRGAPKDHASSGAEPLSRMDELRVEWEARQAVAAALEAELKASEEQLKKAGSTGGKRGGWLAALLGRSSMQGTQQQGTVPNEEPRCVNEDPKLGAEDSEAAVPPAGKEAHEEGPAWPKQQHSRPTVRLLVVAHDGGAVNPAGAVSPAPAKAASPEDGEGREEPAALGSWASRSQKWNARKWSEQ
eukprot:scaffold1.g5306.t1